MNYEGAIDILRNIFDEMTLEAKIGARGHALALATVALKEVEDKYNKLKDLPQYHFDRDEFCKVFHEFFTDDDVYNIEAFCQETEYLDSFILMYDEDEFYILHKNSGIMINWYKHLGRTNTCNREDFTLDDLRVFLKALKEDLTYERVN